MNDFLSVSTQSLRANNRQWCATYSTSSQSSEIQSSYRIWKYTVEKSQKWWATYSTRKVKKTPTQRVPNPVKVKNAIWCPKNTTTKVILSLTWRNSPKKWFHLRLEPIVDWIYQDSNTAEVTMTESVVIKHQPPPQKNQTDKKLSTLIVSETSHRPTNIMILHICDQ